jgi:uncharacterized protein (DUF58 family)
MTALLEPTFLRRLQALRHHLTSEARSGGAADQIARRRGTSAEFREHRFYAPGDDLRRVDWMAYARTGEPVVKLFHSEEDTLVRLLVDASRSLAFGTPPKIDVARRMAAALAYLALAGSRRAQVLVGARSAINALADEPEKLAIGMPRRGQRGFSQLCRELAAIEAKGQTSLTEAIDGVLHRLPRPGMLVVLSDFLDSGDVPAALRRARAAGNDVVLIQILDATELDPDLEGDLALEDSETGELVDVTLDPAALEAYELGLAGLLEELRRWARQNGGAYVRLRTTDDLEDAVRRVLSRAVD